MGVSDGTMIDPAAVLTMPNGSLSTSDSHIYYRIQFPINPARPDGHVGRWMTAKGSVSSGMPSPKSKPQLGHLFSAEVKTSSIHFGHLRSILAINSESCDRIG